MFLPCHTWLSEIGGGMELDTARYKQAQNKRDATPFCTIDDMRQGLLTELVGRAAILASWLCIAERSSSSFRRSELIEA